jgi:hypothetical protein
MSVLHAQVNSSADSSIDKESNASLDAIPSQEDVEQIGGFVVQDSNGKPTRFRSIFTGHNSPRRVLMIFIGPFNNPVRASSHSISNICAGFETTCGMMLIVAGVNSTVRSTYGPSQNPSLTTHSSAALSVPLSPLWAAAWHL